MLLLIEILRYKRSVEGLQLKTRLDTRAFLILSIRSPMSLALSLALLNLFPFLALSEPFLAQLDLSLAISDPSLAVSNLSRALADLSTAD